ncbi:MAG TPA: hypothetical protein ENG89_00280, partial [Candidatus Moranbacteria bacterium]|nr:hypothetical protein [Candidatus Moranbacteria bacterium]
MKRSELFFSAIQVPIDFAMIVLAAISAFAIRDIPQILALKPKLYEFPFESYIKIVLIVVPFFILIYAIGGLYDIRVTRKFWQETIRVFAATSIALVIIIVTIFLKREWFSSRFIILAAWGLVVIYIPIARYLLQSIQKWLLIHKGVGVHRLLLIGGNEKLYQIKKLLKNNLGLGYRVIGQVGYVNLKKIKEIRKQRGIDEMILG